MGVQNSLVRRRVFGSFFSPPAVTGGMKGAKRGQERREGEGGEGVEGAE